MVKYVKFPTRVWIPLSGQIKEATSVNYNEISSRRAIYAWKQIVVHPEVFIILTKADCYICFFYVNNK